MRSADMALAVGKRRIATPLNVAPVHHIRYAWRNRQQSVQSLPVSKRPRLTIDLRTQSNSRKTKDAAGKCPGRPAHTPTRDLTISFCCRVITDHSGTACHALGCTWVSSLRLCDDHVRPSQHFQGVYYTLFTVTMCGTAYGLVSIIKVRSVISDLSVL